MLDVVVKGVLSPYDVNQQHVPQKSGLRIKSTLLIQCQSSTHSHVYCSKEEFTKEHSLTCVKEMWDTIVVTYEDSKEVHATNSVF